MMEFKKYQHLERFGTSEVEGIEDGICHVFPKIDGTNASVWLSNGEIRAGSRKRELTIDSDNAGFFAWVSESTEIRAYLEANPTHRLFGEWLVPHSLKTYREEAWRKFYVFDVAVDISPEDLPHEFANHVRYLPYEEYRDGLEEHGVEYIPPIAIVEHGTPKTFTELLQRNTFLVEDGAGPGEGLVLKRYDFVNRYGRTTWAKLVTSEFKEKHNKAMGPPTMKGPDTIERKIADEYVTTALVDKEYAKIDAINGFTSRDIPRLLGTVYHSLVMEEAWNFVKALKNPTIDFRTLQRLTIERVKQLKPELFA